MEFNNEIKSEWPWKNDNWPIRAKAIAEIIPPEAKVLELGGGLCFLKTMRQELDYKSIDMKPWTSLTTVADFNKNEFPEMGLFDIIVCQGILEYIELPFEFLNTIHKYGRRMLISYYFGSNNVSLRKNCLKIDELFVTLIKTGWKIISMRKVGDTEYIFLCVKYD
jgi:hypothetical protein